MLGLVVTLLVVLLGAAVAGIVITDLFWLTLVAIAGILGTGAAGVGIWGERVRHGAPQPERRAALAVVPPRRGTSHHQAPQDGYEVRRAA